MKEVPANLINPEDFFPDSLWKSCLLGCGGKNLPLIKLLLMDVWVNGLFLSLWDCSHLMAHKQKGWRTGLAKQQNSSECF